VIGILNDYIHHIVNGDAAQQFARLVNNRRGNPVVALEQACHLGVRQGGGNGLHIGDHHFPHRDIGAAGQQFGDRQRAEEGVVAVDHKQVVGDLGNLLVTAQIAQHHIHGEVGPHGDGVCVHQTTGGVLVVIEYFFNPQTVLFRHGLEDFRDHFVGQLLDDVGDIVGVHALEDRHHLGAVHALEKFQLNLFAQLAEHFPFKLFVEQLPENSAGAGWGRLNMVGNIRNIVEHMGDAVEVGRIDDLIDFGQEGELVGFGCHRRVP